MFIALRYRGVRNGSYIFQYLWKNETVIAISPICDESDFMLDSLHIIS